MEAKGVRRLLIVFFAFLNILFLCLYFHESMSNDYIGADYVNAAVKNLTERGISVSSDTFVTRMPHYRAASILTDTDGNYGRKVSDSLISYTLGNVKTRSVELENPDGISITYYDSDEEYSHIQLAKTFYEKNSFYFEYSDNRYANKAQTPMTRYDEFDGDISYDDRRLLSGVVSCFGKSQAFGSRISGCTDYEDGTVYTLVQTLDDIEISDMYVNVLVWNGEILSVKGSWIPVNTDKYYDCSISDSINAVFSLDLDKVTEIVSEKCVYIFKRADENKYYLIPVWEIVYVDADGDTVREIIESDIVNKSLKS